MLSKSYSLPKIIFLDIDDTLYIKDEQRIPQSVKPALLALKKIKVYCLQLPQVTLGIIPIEVRKLIDEVGIDYLLTMNGQYNEFAGKKIIRFSIAISAS